MRISSPAGSPLGLMSMRPWASMVAKARKREASTKAAGSSGAAAGPGVQKSERISALAQCTKHSSTPISSSVALTALTAPLARRVSPIPGIRNSTPAPRPTCGVAAGSRALSGMARVAGSLTRAKPAGPPATATLGPASAARPTKATGEAAIHCAAVASR